MNLSCLILTLEAACASYKLDLWMLCPAAAFPPTSIHSSVREPWASEISIFCAPPVGFVFTCPPKLTLPGKFCFRANVWHHPELWDYHPTGLSEARRSVYWLWWCVSFPYKMLTFHSTARVGVTSTMFETVWMPWFRTQHLGAFRIQQMLRTFRIFQALRERQAFLVVRIMRMLLSLRPPQAYRILRHSEYWETPEHAKQSQHPEHLQHFECQSIGEKYGNNN